jgi:hypothetical protein
MVTETNINEIVGSLKAMNDHVANTNGGSNT